MRRCSQEVSPDTRDDGAARRALGQTAAQCSGGEQKFRSEQRLPHGVHDGLRERGGAARAAAQRGRRTRAVEEVQHDVRPGERTVAARRARGGGGGAGRRRLALRAPRRERPR